MYPIYSRLMIPHWKCNVTDNRNKTSNQTLYTSNVTNLLSTKLLDETVATIISFKVTK